MRYKTKTGLYRATQITLVDSSLPDPTDGDSDLADSETDSETDSDIENETEPDGDDDSEYSESLTGCNCSCDWPGDDFEYLSVNDFTVNSNWKDETDSSANYIVNLEQNPADSDNEGGKALYLRKLEDVVNPVYFSEFGRCDACEISFWVSTEECPSVNNSAVNNINVSGQDDSGVDNYLLKFAIRSILTGTDSYSAYLTLELPEDGRYVKLVPCAASRIFKLHVIPDWNSRTFSVQVDDLPPFVDVPFYNNGVFNVSYVEIYQESIDIGGYFDEFELKANCGIDGDVDGDADLDEEDDAITNSFCLPCTSSEECDDGYLCLANKNYCVRKASYNTSIAKDCPDGFNVQDADVYGSEELQVVCYPETASDLKCNNNSIYYQDICGFMEPDMSYACTAETECVDGLYYCKESNCSDGINNNSFFDSVTDCKDSDCFYSVENTSCDQCKPCEDDNGCSGGYLCITALNGNDKYCAYKLGSINDTCPEDTTEIAFGSDQVCQNYDNDFFCVDNTYFTADSCGYVTKKQECGSGSKCNAELQGCIEKDCSNNFDDDFDTQEDCEDQDCIVDPACTAQCTPCTVGNSSCPENYECLDDGSGSKTVCLKKCYDSLCPEGSKCDYRATDPFCYPNNNFSCDESQKLWVSTGCGTEVVYRDCNLNDLICVDDTISEHAHCE